MQKLEAAITRVESSASDRSHNEIAAIKEQVRALSQNGGTQDVINRVREEVVGQVGEVAADVGSITSKLRDVDRKYDTAIAAQEKATEKRGGEMLQRVKGVEVSLKQYKESLRDLAGKVDDRRVEDAQEQLHRLAGEVKSGGEDLQKVVKAVELLAVQSRQFEHHRQESANTIEALQSQVKELGVRNDNLEQEVVDARKKAEEAVNAAGAVNALTAAVDVPSAENRELTTMMEPGVTDQTPGIVGQGPAPAKVTRPRGRPKKISQAKAPRRGVDKAVAASTQAKEDTNNIATPASTMLDSQPKESEARKTTATSLRRLSREFRRIDSRTQMPVVKSGRGYVVVEEKLEDDELAAFLSKIDTAPHARGRQMIDTVQEAPVDQVPPQPRRSSRSRSPGLIRAASIVQSIEVPDSVPLHPKRRTIDQRDGNQQNISGSIFAPFAKTHKPRLVHDTIDPSIDMNAPRVTRSQKAGKTPQATPQPMMAEKMPKRKTPKEKGTVKKEPRSTPKRGPVPGPKKRTIAQAQAASPQKRGVARPEAGELPRPVKKRRTIPQD